MVIDIILCKCVKSAESVGKSNLNLNKNERILTNNYNGNNLR